MSLNQFLIPSKFRMCANITGAHFVDKYSKQIRKKNSRVSRTRGSFKNSSVSFGTREENVVGNSMWMKMMIERDERASFEGFTNQVISGSNYYRFDHKSTSSRVLRQFYSYLICKTNCCELETEGEKDSEWSAELSNANNIDAIFPLCVSSSFFFSSLIERSLYWIYPWSILNRSNQTSTEFMCNRQRNSHIYCNTMSLCVKWIIWNEMICVP